MKLVANSPIPQISETCVNPNDLLSGINKYVNFTCKLYFSMNL